MKKLTVKQIAELTGLTPRAVSYRKAKGWKGKKLLQPGIWPQVLGGARKRGAKWDVEDVPAQRWAEIRWALEVVPSAVMVAEAFPELPRGAVNDFANGRYDRLPGFDPEAVEAAYQALDKDNVRVTGL